MRTQERKADTRHKIKLGGLVKKAGLDSEPTAIILGLLLEAAEKLQGKQSDKHRDQWRIRGDLELSISQEI